ncbi:MAG: HAD-IB family hydrolase [Solirubrobacterales bacterium]
MEKLAIFDVDYTLTRKETLWEFFKFMIKKNPSLIIRLPKSAGSAFLYAIGIFTAKKAKENFIAFIDGVNEKEMRELVKEFYDKRFVNIFYNDAIDTMIKLKADGYRIILISASAEFYLNELYNIKEVDKIIGTRFIVDNGFHTSQIEGENCKGEEKVKRLMAYLKEENLEVDFENSYMFSDSLSDSPLFYLVGNPYLINSNKKNHNFNVLYWK